MVSQSTTVDFAMHCHIIYINISEYDDMVGHRVLVKTSECPVFIFVTTPIFDFGVKNLGDCFIRERCNST